MMDRNTEILLSAIKELCPSGGYTVVSADDIAEKAGADFTEEETARMLASLDERGYINLRFSQGGEYCLSLLPSGLNFSSGRVKKGFFVRNRQFFITFLCAFAGAFLGCLAAGK